MLTRYKKILLIFYMQLVFMEKFNLIFIFSNRLTPVYAIVLAFYCTLLIRVGDGPMWSEKIGAEVDRCQLSWWTNILYINNYVGADKLVCLVIMFKNNRCNLMSISIRFFFCIVYDTILVHSMRHAFVSNSPNNSESIVS